MAAYYNEIDKFAAAWLRELIKSGAIADGDVDERSIADVQPGDLVGYTQCHFFAGIGGWSYAMRLAEWPDDEPVWTGSCPCQPFSQAGKGEGEDDPRHLWPHLFRLISESGPLRCFGEQVAGPDGLRWLAGVHADLEAIAYRLGAANLCAAGEGAPHIRQRLYWVADTEDSNGRAGERSQEEGTWPDGEWRRRDRLRCDAGGLVDAKSGGCGVLGHAACPRGGGYADSADLACWMEHADEHGHEPRRLHQGSRESEYPASFQQGAGWLSLAGGEGLQGSQPETVLGTGWREEGRTTSKLHAARFWDGYDIIHCLDGKARRVEAGTFPLAHGIPARVGRLRGYGNAIVPETAARFVRAYIDSQSKGK